MLFLIKCRVTIYQPTSFSRDVFIKISSFSKDSINYARKKHPYTHTLTTWSSKVFLRIRRYFSFKFHALSSLCFLNAWLVTNRMVRFSNVFYVLLRSIQRDLISIRFSSNSENKSNSMLSTTTDVSVILICRCFFLRNNIKQFWLSLMNGKIIDIKNVQFVLL